MSIRRLLDAIALFKAARGVVSKHAALRSHQLDVYNKTSSLAKAVKNQTDRVTLTVQAASALARRVNGPNFIDAYTNSKLRTEQQTNIKQDRSHERSEADHAISPEKNLRSNESSFIAGTNVENREHLALEYAQHDQASLSTGSGANALKNTNADLEISPSSQPSLPESEDPVKARFLQRQAEAQIPSQSAGFPFTEAHSGRSTVDCADWANGPLEGQNGDVYYSRPASSAPVLSSLPRVKLPKNTETAQESDRHVSDESMNQDVFYSSSSINKVASLPVTQTFPQQDPPSEAMYSEIFHSPRVAKMLSGNKGHNKESPDLELKGNENAPDSSTKPAMEKDEDTFSSRTTSGVVDLLPKDRQEPPKQPEDESVEDLAKDGTAETSERSLSQEQVYHRPWSLIAKVTD